MLPEQVVQLKKRLRTQLVRVVGALTLDEITKTLQDERRLQALLSEVVHSTTSKFEGADISDVQHLLFSIVGDMPKCVVDLRGDLLEDIQMKKLQHWYNWWKIEKEKSTRARNIDTENTFNKKLRKETLRDSRGFMSSLHI
ncbi:hypothetical protein GOP47_0025847 [Adiantum capillus-veneris]|uniref:Uncharacterized protein n=1 Tax=Adiantum capillus-veneris TaxID=13818 RepID=A0A9D4Z2H8_ADICA|nr:hypothetical protein GOP47_0025847 [Adiantum capillus-veneris]